MGESRSFQLTIVRHGTAAPRQGFSGPDRDRPLTADGSAQARALVPVLADRHVGAIVSSPARRCIETVTPLAESLGVTIEIVDALDEESSGDAALNALIERGLSMSRGDVIGASHGPIFDDLLRKFDGAIGARSAEIEKAGRVVLSIADGAVTDLSTFRAPALNTANSRGAPRS